MKGILFYADDKSITAKTGRIVMGNKSKRTHDKVFEDRKNMLEDLILHNDLYVPMKTKELAILMQVPKEDRHELQAVLDSLVAEGRIGVSKKANTVSLKIQLLLEYTRRQAVVLVLLLSKAGKMIFLSKNLTMAEHFIWIKLWLP